MTMNAAHPGVIYCTLEPVTDLDRIGSAWRALQERAGCSYFQSWSWIGTWLSLLGGDAQPMLLTVRQSGQVIGLAIVTERVKWRHGTIRSRALYVNKTGNENLDEITVEYNGLLVEPHRQVEAMQAVFDFLLSDGRWDEVFIDAARDGQALCSLSGRNWAMRRNFPWHAWGVDLQALRTSGKTYLDMLSSNTRYQVRRNLRAYEELGPMRVETASNREEAEAYMDELRRLHQAYWTAKGKPGAFANRYLDRFHRKLVAERLALGEIQLMRVGFGERWIGYLYAFLWEGAVLDYQAGFDYAALPAHNRPGAVSHYAAIEFNLAQGARYYDFLGGDGQHKRTLATASVPLDWMVAQRRCFKFRIEDAMRAARERLLRRGAAQTGEPQTEHQS